MIRSFLLALFATLVVWGRGLSSGETFTPDGQTMTIRPNCRGGGPGLACVAPPERQRVFDPGSPAWVTSPTSYFLQHARQRGEPRPQWNPYAGSGYPLALDGHSSRFSPSEWFLSHVPGDQGQDIVIFVRFLSWTFALVWAIALFEKSALRLTVMAFAVTLAPYGASYVHIAFLDVDLLGPWFLLLLLLLARKQIPPRAALLAALGLGLLVGAFAFPQAQLVLVVALGVLAGLAAPFLGLPSLKLWAALTLGVFLVVPSWLPLLNNLDQFVSSRSLQCVCEQSVGWRNLLGEWLTFSSKPVFPAAVTLAGLMLLPWMPRRLWFVPLTVAVFGIWLALGLPSAACALPLVSGLRFSRHLQPHLQALFLFGTCVAINRLGHRLDRARTPLLILLPISLATLSIAASAPVSRLGTAIWVCFLVATILTLVVATLPWGRARWQGPRRTAFALALMLLVFPVYVLRSHIALYFLKGKPTTTETAPLPAVFDPATPLGKVQELSREQDRRHFSPQGWIYPNWSQALEILDLRSLNALYPSGIHQLNAGLFAHWDRDPAHLLNPDRFTTMAKARQFVSTDFQRVLALHRVSLLTFVVGHAFFPSSGPYQRAKCELLGADAVQGSESYLCPEVGGVGFFPEIVRVVGTRADTLNALKRMSPTDLTKTALLGPELDPGLGPSGPKVAKGQVVAMARSANHLLYWLYVEKPGTFVVADAYFRGWTATVNGQPIAISRANLAFKAVDVPQGFVDLHFHFEVAGP